MSVTVPSSAADIAPPAWDRLELEVQQLVEEYTTWRSRARVAEQRVAELEAALRSIADGSLDPLAIAERLERVEAENTTLRDRVKRARNAVHHMQARLEFLREER